MRKKLFLFFLLFFLLAGSYCFAAVNIEFPLPGLPESPTLPQYILYFFQLGIALGGVLAVLSLVFSGIQLIYSSGNAEGISEAKKRATSAVLGLILLLSSFILITTINPKLKNVEFTEGLRSTGMLFFVKTDDDVIGCPTGECRGPDRLCSTANCNLGVSEKPASMSMENLDSIKKEYGKIKWKSSITGLDGTQISNCRWGEPNLVYVIYLYRDYNLKNFYQMFRMKCGSEAVDITVANSYKVIEEKPGVYFYGAANCIPKGDSTPTPHTTSIPGDIGIGQDVYSIRIVNGPDPKKEPFYGVIYFNSTEYRTSENYYGFQHFMFSANLSQNNIYDNNSRCFSGTQIGPLGGFKKLPSIGVSWVIYNWVGFDENGQISYQAGNGVTLFSEVSWGGGRYDINPISETSLTSWLQMDLKTKPVNYSNTTVPKERQNVCKFFDPYYSCLKSFEIKGKYLVLVSSKKDEPYKYNYSTRAQIFPISSRLLEAYGNRRQGFSIERGTPELKTDYIGNKSAYYMEIIPLAERLR